MGRDDDVTDVVNVGRWDGRADGWTVGLWRMKWRMGRWQDVADVLADGTVAGWMERWDGGTVGRWGGRARRRSSDRAYAHVGRRVHSLGASTRIRLSRGPREPTLHSVM